MAGFRRARRRPDRMADNLLVLLRLHREWRWIIYNSGSQLLKKKVLQNAQKKGKKYINMLKAYLYK